MFIIVPKRSENVVPTHGSNSLSRKSQFSNDERNHIAGIVGDSSSHGSARVHNACDSCRLRKAKCSGGRPCERCKDKQVICVYAKLKRPELPVNAQSIALLHNQQSRLVVALKQMASIIAKHESGEDKPADAFNTIDLIETYASEDRGSDETPRPTTRKRQRARSNERDAGTKHQKTTHKTAVDTAAIMNYNGECSDHGDGDEQSEEDAVEENQHIEPYTGSFGRTEDSWHQDAAQLTDLGSSARSTDIQAMYNYMQMMQSSRSEPRIKSIAAPPSTLPPLQEQEQALVLAETEAPVVDLANFDFANLIDWEASTDIFSDYMSADREAFTVEESAPGSLT